MFKLPIKLEAAPLGSRDSPFTNLVPLLELRHVQSDETLQEKETLNVIFDECAPSFITFKGSSRTRQVAPQMNTTRFCGSPGQPALEWPDPPQSSEGYSEEEEDDCSFSKRDRNSSHCQLMAPGRDSLQTLLVARAGVIQMGLKQQLTIC